MKRRHFIQNTAAASAVPLFAAANTSYSSSNEGEKEIYELRTYEIRFRGNQKLLMDYLQNALKPALEKVGVNHFMMFTELGNADPKKLYVLISHPTAEAYLKAQNLTQDAEFVSAANKYDTAPANQPIFNRFSSMLFLAFDGMPQLKAPKADAGLFELRIYEGYNEDAVRRKIQMFNVEEITLFHKVGLYPVFFGDVLAGPYRPCLAYMLNFKDMDERNANWKTFLDHPEWKAMLGNEKYANTVSNIHKIFLQPV